MTASGVGRASRSDGRHRRARTCAQDDTSRAPPRQRMPTRRRALHALPCALRAPRAGGVPWSEKRVCEGESGPRVSFPDRCRFRCFGASPTPRVELRAEGRATRPRAAVVTLALATHNDTPPSCGPRAHATRPSAHATRPHAHPHARHGLATCSRLYVGRAPFAGWAGDVFGATSPGPRRTRSRPAQVQFARRATSGENPT